MPAFPRARPDFARCRSLRHAWTVTGETESNGSKLIVLRCEACGTVRYDRWNTRTGQRWGHPSYSWPDGYRDTEPGHDADWWRMTFAEHLYSAGILTDAPSPDTRKRGTRRTG
jgi:hypothetical protein